MVSFCSCNDISLILPFLYLHCIMWIYCLMDTLYGQTCLKINCLSLSLSLSFKKTQAQVSNSQQTCPLPSLMKCSNTDTHYSCFSIPPPRNQPYSCCQLDHGRCYHGKQHHADMYFRGPSQWNHCPLWGPVVRRRKLEWDLPWGRGCELRGWHVRIQLFEARRPQGRGGSHRRYKTMEQNGKVTGDSVIKISISWTWNVLSMIWRSWVWTSVELKLEWVVRNAVKIMINQLSYLTLQCFQLVEHFKHPWIYDYSNSIWHSCLSLC